MVMVRVVDGSLKKGDKIQFMATGRSYEVTAIGCFSPHPVPLSELSTGEVGFIAANIKSVEDTKIGDTVTLASRPTDALCPASRK